METHSFIELCKDLHYPELSIPQLRKKKEFNEMYFLYNHICKISDEYIFDIMRTWEYKTQLTFTRRVMDYFGDSYSVWLILMSMMID